ncbi:hypothetical protein [Krasilnikoviella flava]|uniref:Methionine synthase II (Cobalamin-independent) n=1 Tax=Krasilnikoviella flava TaxID=526729 RepID=A0A1T5I775_9MICO|nr:hypothetical protein [Krasilnikoviella flava]SKC34772.1 hypothetical protein SAMN04324258_0015 [Krasilnikoviella flava]
MPDSLTSNLTLRGAHLVGSVNLPTARDTLRTVATRLGSHARRIPDGEAGERFHWILFQGTRFEAVEGLSRVGGEPVVVAGFDVRPHVLDGSVPADELQFGPLGYAEAARASYADFVALRAEGVIAPGTRFQVCLPSPLAAVTTFVAPADRAAVHPVYEAALVRELEEILAAVPAEDLAVQVDLATEFAFVEGANLGGGAARAWFENDGGRGADGAAEDVVQGCAVRAARFAAHVPAAVQLGFHLCYGDVAEKHFVEPTDTGRLVEMANSLVVAVPRPITWVHLPVPIDRDDVAYVAPLAQLALDAATELYLGVLHHEDGAAGARRRLAAVAQVLGERTVGVATECGFGRGPSERTAALLDLHVEVLAA